MKKSVPLMDNEIRRAISSRAFAYWGDGGTDSVDGGSVRKLHTLEAKQTGDDQLVLSVSDVCWNSSGSTVAVVYKVTFLTPPIPPL